MTADFFATLGFIVISTFTPGPNNISSAVMGVLHGYRRSLNYLLGISTGFLIVISLCAVVSAAVLSAFPSLEMILRWVGAAYLLYLAYGILKASYAFESETAKPLTFINGFMLQLLNPKLIVYGLTLFSTFLAGIAVHPPQLLIAAVLLTLLSFVSISVWAAFGTFIKRYLRDERARRAINIVMALFLVYTALELAQIL